MAKIIISGFGGQGILFAGRLLAQAALEENKQTTFFPSYGAEIRGGTAHCLVTISKEEIASPIFKNPDLVILLNQPSADKFLPRMKKLKNSLAVLNSSLIKKISVPRGIEILEVPATELAREMGQGKVANSVALGVLVAKSQVVSMETVRKAMKVILTGGKSKLLDINFEAFKKGADRVKIDE